MTMTLLDLCEGLAKNVGLAIPTVVFAGTDRTSVEMLQCANDTGDELARRVDWSMLRTTVTITGTGGDLATTMPAAFDRLSAGVAVLNNSDRSIVRSLTRSEAMALRTGVVGLPRYFLIVDKVMNFWPYIPNGYTVLVKYQSASWCDNGATNSDAFLEDNDTPRVPDRLFLQGMIVRWRRQKGMDYADFEAEYEATLAQYGEFDNGMRL